MPTNRLLQRALLSGGLTPEAARDIQLCSITLLVQNAIVPTCFALALDGGSGPLFGLPGLIDAATAWHDFGLSFVLTCEC